MTHLSTSESLGIVTEGTMERCNETLENQTLETEQFQTLAHPGCDTDSLNYSEVKALPESDPHGLRSMHIIQALSENISQGQNMNPHGLLLAIGINCHKLLRELSSTPVGLLHTTFEGPYTGPYENTIDYDNWKEVINLATENDDVILIGPFIR